MKSGFTYIMTNKHHNVLYTGCTTDIIRRVTQHKRHFYKGSFSDKYNCEYCVYFEVFPDYASSINRENQIKNMTKKEKLDFLNSTHKCNFVDSGRKSQLQNKERNRVSPFV